MGLVTECLFLTDLECMSLLRSVCLGCSSALTAAASHLGSECISEHSGHWICCNRDSNVNCIWIIIKLFYAVLLY